MAAIDEATEQRIAESRGRIRQDKHVPWLIRDDGMLFPNVPLIAKKQNFRPYHGDLQASLEDRLNYLKGIRSQRRVINSAAMADAEAPFDIAKASKDELIQFALDEHGVTIDPETHLNKIRADVARLAGLLPPVRGGAPAANAAGGLPVKQPVAA